MDQSEDSLSSLYCKTPILNSYLEKTVLATDSEGLLVIRNVSIAEPFLKLNNQTINFENAEIDYVASAQIRQKGLQLQKGVEQVILYGEYSDWLPIIKRYVFQKNFKACYRITSKSRPFCLISHLHRNQISLGYISRQWNQTQLFMDLLQLRRSNHVNAYQIEEAFKTSKHFIVVFEPFNAVTLDQYLNHNLLQTEEEAIKTILRQIVSFISHLAARGLSHAYLNSKNIFIDKGLNIKVAFVGREDNRLEVGPEDAQLLKDDVLAVGLLMLQMLGQDVSLDNLQSGQLGQSVYDALVNKNQLSQGGMSFLRAAIKGQDRVSMADLMTHPWLLGSSQKQLQIKTPKLRRYSSTKSLTSTSDNSISPQPSLKPVHLSPIVGATKLGMSQKINKRSIFGKKCEA